MPGFEPGTSRVQYYFNAIKKCARQDSNLQPGVYKTPALPLSYSRIEMKTTALPLSYMPIDLNIFYPIYTLTSSQKSDIIC